MGLPWILILSVCNSFLMAESLLVLDSSLAWSGLLGTRYVHLPSVCSSLCTRRSTLIVFGSYIGPSFILSVLSFFASVLPVLAGSVLCLRVLLCDN